MIWSPRFPKGRRNPLTAALIAAGQEPDAATRRLRIVTAIREVARAEAQAARVTAGPVEVEPTCPCCGIATPVDEAALTALAEAGLRLECGACWQASEPGEWLPVGRTEPTDGTKQPADEMPAREPEDNTQWKTTI